MRFKCSWLAILALAACLTLTTPVCAQQLRQPSPSVKTFPIQPVVNGGTNLLRTQWDYNTGKISQTQYQKQQFNNVVNTGGAIVGRYVGEGLGGAIGSFFGQPEIGRALGGMVGEFLGGRVSSLFGD